MGFFDLFKKKTDKITATTSAIGKQNQMLFIFPVNERRYADGKRKKI